MASIINDAYVRHIRCGKNSPESGPGAANAERGFYGVDTGFPAIRSGMRVSAFSESFFRKGNVMQPVLRPAQMRDAKRIHSLLTECSAEGLLLPRSLSNLYGQIRDFRILETEDGAFIGCAALAVIWENLAEVRSLAIAKPWRGSGFGNILVDDCCKDARGIGIDRVFALTYQVRFFERNGFGVVNKDTLPQRVWIVCANCPRFPDCDEVAVMRQLDAPGRV